MNTRVVVAGSDSWFSDDGLVWTGDLPLLGGTSTILLTDDDDRENIFQVSKTAIHLKGKDAWQIVYVLDNDGKPGRRMIGG